MFKSLLVVVVSCLLASVATGRSAMGSSLQHLDSAQGVQEAAPEQAEPQTIWSDLSTIYRIYQQCASDNLSVCLKLKLLVGLENAFRQSKEVRISDEIKFVQSREGGDSEKNPAPKMVDKDEILANLPRALEDREESLNSLIFKAIGTFLQDHTLQVKFPDMRSIEKSFDESRKKKDKKGGGAYIMIPLLLGGTFVPIAYGALAMLAGKALIVSKLALVLASIIGIKKLLNSGGHKESQHEVVVSSGGHSSGWGRDIDLAYNAYDPKNSKKQV